MRELTLAVLWAAALALTPATADTISCDLPQTDTEIEDVLTWRMDTAASMSVTDGAGSSLAGGMLWTGGTLTADAEAKSLTQSLGPEDSYGKVEARAWATFTRGGARWTPWGGPTGVQCPLVRDSFELDGDSMSMGYAEDDYGYGESLATKHVTASSVTWMSRGIANLEATWDGGAYAASPGQSSLVTGQFTVCEE